MARSNVPSRSRGSECGTITTTRICSRKEFHTYYTRQRALADRGHHEFSLLTLRIVNPHAKERALEIISQALDQLSEERDRAGWLSHDEVAILLPGMCGESAAAYVQAISFVHEELARLVQWHIVTYPLVSELEQAQTERTSSCDATSAFTQSHSQVADEGSFGRAADGKVERRRAEAHGCSIPIKALPPKATASPCPPWKRVMDVIGAVVGLLLFSPLMLTIAVMIKLSSSGPVFFRQQRYGVKGRPFRVWKFRTIESRETPDRHTSHLANLMASNGRLLKRDTEHTFVPGGRLLRKYGLDELPQLFNVLVGEMSLVGPRPDVLPIESYRAWQRCRFNVLPGITGLWQVSGKNETTFTTMMRLDVVYVRRRSVGLDLAILARTIPAVVWN